MNASLMGLELDKGHALLMTEFSFLCEPSF